MVTLLRKLFIKDYKNTSDPIVRKKHGVLAAVYGIISNLILVALKLTAALLIAFNTNWVLFPIALIADAANNASDALSSIVTLVSFNLAAKPGDDEHPFGHERIEYVAAMIVSFLVVVFAVEIFKNSLEKVIEGAFPQYDVLSIVFLGVAVLMKLLQFHVVGSLGKAINSPALKATATDAILDSLITSVIAICAVLSNTLQWNFLDGWLGMGVAIFIFITGLSGLIESSSPLIGEGNNKELVKKIETLVNEDPLAIGVHDIICHSYGPTKYFVSLHVEIDENTSLQKAHDIAESIENRIKDQLKVTATVHMDPARINDPEIEDIKKDVDEILKKHDEFASAHDFRIIETDLVKKVNFDVVIPYSKINEKEEIYNEIVQKFKEKGRNHEVIIVFEHHY